MQSETVPGEALPLQQCRSCKLREEARVKLSFRLMLGRERSVERRSC